jgi:hypothetical protein
VPVHAAAADCCAAWGCAGVVLTLQGLACGSVLHVLRQQRLAAAIANSFDRFCLRAELA